MSETLPHLAFKELAKPDPCPCRHRMVNKGRDKYAGDDAPWFVEPGNQEQRQKLGFIPNLGKGDGEGRGKKRFHKDFQAGQSTKNKHRPPADGTAVCLGSCRRRAETLRNPATSLEGSSMLTGSLFEIEQTTPP